jgi:hypothetical protein
MACFICGLAPCECGKPPKKPVPKKAAPKPVPEPVVVAVPVDERPTRAPLSAVPVIQHVIPAPRVQPKARGELVDLPVDKGRQEAEDDERRAITVLFTSGLIAWEDMVEHRDKLLMTPLEASALIWRARRDQRNVST